MPSCFNADSIAPSPPYPWWVQSLTTILAFESKYFTLTLLSLSHNRFPINLKTLTGPNDHQDQFRTKLRYTHIWIPMTYHTIIISKYVKSMFCIYDKEINTILCNNLEKHIIKNMIVAHLLMYFYFTPETNESDEKLN